MHIGFWPSIAGDEISARLRKIAGAQLTIVDDMEKFAAAAPQIDALVIGGHFFKAEAARIVHERAKKLRFIQAFTAGYEGLEEHGVPPGVVVANAGDSWSPAVAEHGMALLLALVKKLETPILNKPGHKWDRAFSARMGSLEGMTLAIVGYGSIGRFFAQFARPFGMHLVGLRRNPQPDPLVDEVLPISELNAVLARADAILVAVPYSKATDKMMGAAQFAACKPGALLINLARGGLVDQVALKEALASGQLGGAAVDVTSPEPLPADDPFWDSPNLILTPHVAGACGPVGRVRLAEFIGANLERFVTGKPVQSIVELRAPA
jgi:phosphoglycerate dehydrogenase-like enzyme